MRGESRTGPAIGVVLELGQGDDKVKERSQKCFHNAPTPAVISPLTATSIETELLCIRDGYRNKTQL